ncbi:hypothetical protein CEXT_637871 [Caerostris extrusa]|uniref:Uncharacterized protein n=1 Tax=Caerostris extrusa TaxID=172846 RepID=A0AAV4VIN9_CAEEX|nr:hypothetical protein CEXT_637871 [Caerostris extrusa]
MVVVNRCLQIKVLTIIALDNVENSFVRIRCFLSQDVQPRNIPAFILLLQKQFFGAYVFMVLHHATLISKDNRNTGAVSTSIHLSAADPLPPTRLSRLKFLIEVGYE